MFSPQTGFSEDEMAKLDEWLDFVYDDFTTKVARGPEHDAARPSTRSPAAGSGPVPTRSSGGSSTSWAVCSRAFEIARERAGLPHDAPLRPVPAVPPLQRLRPARNSDDPAAYAQARMSGGGLSEWGGHARLAEALGLPQAGPLLSLVEPLR